jgi:hypothetical protein
MTNTIIVHKGRTNKVTVSLGMDVSTDILTSEIRAMRDPTSDLIATWDVDFDTDGVDGEVVLTLDDVVTAAIDVTIGYMDIKRVTNGEPLSVFDRPLKVEFKNVVTA